MIKRWFLVKALQCAEAPLTNTFANPILSLYAHNN